MTTETGAAASVVAPGSNMIFTVVTRGKIFVGFFVPTFVTLANQKLLRSKRTDCVKTSSTFTLNSTVALNYRAQPKFFES